MGSAGEKLKTRAEKKYYSLDSRLTLRNTCTGVPSCLEFHLLLHFVTRYLLAPARPFLPPVPLSHVPTLPRHPLVGSTIPQSCPRIWSRPRRLTRPLTYVMNPDGTSLAAHAFEPRKGQSWLIINPIDPPGCRFWQVRTPRAMSVAQRFPRDISVAGVHWRHIIPSYAS